MVPCDLLEGVIHMAGHLRDIHMTNINQDTEDEPVKLGGRRVVKFIFLSFGKGSRQHVMDFGGP